MMGLTDECFNPSFKNLFLSSLLSHSFPLLLRGGRGEVEYLNPVQLIRSPRMINGWISSCLSDRDESFSTPLISRNSISIIEVEKEEWKPGSSTVLQH
jgi:hypothetical protein